MGSVTTGVHVRDNSSITARLEKQLLIWMARRLPQAINSDHLSALGLASMAAAGLAFAAFHVIAWAAAGVIVALALNWFGDSLDGTVARVRNQQRPRYGFYVDHVIDLAGTTLLVAGMACSGLMQPLVAGAVRAAYSPRVTPFGGAPVRLFDIDGVIATAGLAAVFVISSARNTRTLYLAEPMPVGVDEQRAA